MPSNLVMDSNLNVSLSAAWNLIPTFESSSVKIFPRYNYLELNNLLSLNIIDGRLPSNSELESNEPFPTNSISMCGIANVKGTSLTQLSIIPSIKTLTTYQLANQYSESYLVSSIEKKSVLSLQGVSDTTIPNNINRFLPPTVCKYFLSIGKSNGAMSIVINIFNGYGKLTIYGGQYGNDYTLLEIKVAVSGLSLIAPCGKAMIIVERTVGMNYSNYELDFSYNIDGNDDGTSCSNFSKFMLLICLETLFCTTLYSKQTSIISFIFIYIVITYDIAFQHSNKFPSLFFQSQVLHQSPPRQQSIQLISTLLVQ